MILGVEILWRNIKKFNENVRILEFFTLFWRQGEPFKTAKFQFLKIKIDIK